METTTQYSIVRNRPIARFRYKGSHSKPVRREVWLTEVCQDVLTGYEVREGNQTHDITKAKIKSFRRDKIQDLERLPRSIVGA